MRSVKVLAADTQNLLEVGAITLDDAGQVMIDGGAVSHQAGITAGTIYDSSVTSEQNILNALNDIDQNLADTINLFRRVGGRSSVCRQCCRVSRQRERRALLRRVAGC